MSITWVWISAFLVGLTGSGHCLGMCGGIAAAFTPVASQKQGAGKVAATLVFNLGRLASYSVAGALAGALSFVIGDKLDITVWSNTLRLLTGLFIVLIGITLLLQLPLTRFLERLGLPVWRGVIAPLTHSLRPVTTLRSGFLLGTLWGWIPCGMVYSMLLVALMSGQPVNGALVMFFFGLGTLPALTTGGVLLTRLFRGDRQRLARYAGMLCLVVGFWTALAPQLPMPGFQQHPLSANASLCESPAK